MASKLTKQEVFEGWLATIAENLQEHFSGHERLSADLARESTRSELAQQFAYVQLFVVGAPALQNAVVLMPPGQTFDEKWALKQLSVRAGAVDPTVALYAIEQWIELVGDQSRKALDKGRFDPEEWWWDGQ